MNVDLQPDGSIRTVAPTSEPGDYVELRADMDLIVAISTALQTRAHATAIASRRCR